MFFSNFKVRTKLALILVVMSFIPGAAIFGVYQFQEKKFEADYSAAFGASAATISEIIDRNLFERYGDVQAFGYNAASHEPANFKNPVDTNPLIIAMNNYMKAYGFYSLMMLVSPEGDVLAVNSKNIAGEPVNTSFLYQMNFKDANWFKDAINGNFLKGTNGFTGTAIQHPELNELVAKVYNNKGYVIPLSAQVHNDAGQLVGVWVNFAEFSFVEDIIKQERKNMDAQGMPNADMMIFDEKGITLVDVDQDSLDAQGNIKHDFDTDLLKKNFLTLGNQATKLALEGKEGTTREFSPDSKEDTLFAYSKTNGVYDFPGLGWAVVLGESPDTVFDVMDAVKKSMIVSFASLVFLMTLVSIWMGILAARPLKKATATMGELTNGNLDVSIDGSQSKDEFGDVSRALQVFKDSMIKTRELAAKQEELKREAELDKKQGMAMLANDFDSRTSGIIQALASAATEMQATAHQMTNSSANTAAASSIVAAAATEADSNVQTVASAAEELSASSSEIAKQISNVAQKSTRASHEAQNTSREVSELNTLADSIGEVVGAIKGIAEQTNLLALNATIEAARAGEAGKGFAVVADEVKKLAMETAQKTEQIDERVGRIQQAIRTSVEAVQRIISDVKQIDEATTTVASAVEEQNAATAEIGRNVSEASTGTQQVAQTIVEVQRNAEETGQAASTVLEAAGELAKISNDLKEQVDGFLDEIRNG